MSDSAATASAGPPRTARGAVAALFFVNGAIFANWVPRIPAVKSALGLSDGLLGVALLGIGIGGLGASLLAGGLAGRYGSRRVTLVACLLLCSALALPGIAPSWPALGGALMVFGAADASMDVGMNAHGVAVQEKYGRSIMNGFHGFWSLGAVLGSLTGSFAASRGIPVEVHLGFAGVALGVFALAATPWLLPASTDQRHDRPTPKRRRSRPGEGSQQEYDSGGWRATARAGRGRGGRGAIARSVHAAHTALPTRALLVLGLIALLASVVEDAPASWSAVYMTEDLGTAPGMAGLAFAAFTAAMTVGRLLADRVVERFGPARTTRTGISLSAIALATGLILGDPVAAIAAFAVVGLGTSTLFPLSFSAAGNLPDVPPGRAIGMVALTARCGILLSPLIIGGLAELLSLPVALGVVVLTCVVLVVLAPGLAPARRAASQAAQP